MRIDSRLTHVTFRRLSLGAVAAAWMAAAISGCAPRSPIPPGQPAPTATLIPTPLRLDLSAIEQAQWDLYDPDPEHLWNRVWRHLYSRATPDGQTFGHDALDPLLWYDSTHLLEGDPYWRAAALLDEFLNTKGAALVADPVKRAMFQRDLWAVFDWLAIGDDHGEQRAALRGRLARILRAVALTGEQIGALPDNYALAANSGHFYPGYAQDDPRTGYLPAALMQPDGEWLLLGREGGPAAMAHTDRFPFYGRSAFLVYIHAPGGRAEALAFARQINADRALRAPAGLEVALVRRALLINAEGEIMPSPLTESVQLRRFDEHGEQVFFEFVLRRELLFAGLAGGLQATGGEFALFQSHGDPFQYGPEFIHEAEIPGTCRGCHVDRGMGIVGPRSILSVSRERFALGDGQLPDILETSIEAEAQAVIAWKQQHPTWIALAALWDSNSD